jgi:hypothetical protein
VDILRGRDGAPYVLEVNSMPAWSGLQSVCDVDIAAILAQRFAMRLGLNGAGSQPDDEGFARLQATARASSPIVSAAKGGRC